MFYFYFTIIYSLWSFKYNFCTFFINVDWICNFVLPCLWNSRYHLFWLRSVLLYVITLPSIKFLCIVVCLFVVLSGVFPMLLSVFLRPMTFDNPSTPGKEKVSKNKNRFARIILKYIQLIIHSETLRNVSYVNRLTI